MTIHGAIDKAGCGCDHPRHLEDMLSVEEAVAIAREMVTPVLDVESIDLGKAAGRVTARHIHAPRPMPFFDQSAMDGFAVRSVDLTGEGPWRLAVRGTIAAGDRASKETLSDGTAMRIFTGAPVPGDADAVVMIEDCDDAGDVVVVRRRPRAGENIRHRGSDIERGALLVAEGTCIEPRHVGLLAANGYDALRVFRRPRIGIFSTGSELVAPGAPGDGRIFDANRPMLIALAERAGAEVADLGVVDDDPAETVAFFGYHAGRFDMLLSSGAVSAGGRDFIRPALAEAGGVVHAWKVALKPGKPVLFGSLGDTAYFGLPGNPLAAYVGFELFVREQILRLGGAGDIRHRETRALAGVSAGRKTGRTEFAPVRITSWSPDGLPVVEMLGNRSSGTLHPLCQADGLVVIPADLRQIEPGRSLRFLALGPELA